ncbi:MAG: FtsX-like permease family protein [Actinomycetota bacterium]|nr:FtsX-like permease family protein [Actinomycetota bacterium]
MTVIWIVGLIRRRGGRLIATAAGVALAVALIASLGTFLTASQTTMTQRALRSVAVDWQVQVQPGADPTLVKKLISARPGVAALEPVDFATTTGFGATIGGSTQTTGSGVVLGLGPNYRAAFPAEIRQLAGSTNGALLAQQTAANLHARPGDRITIGLPAGKSVTVTVAGVIDLPQADSLFQHVGAPPQSQPTAPPDNVLLLPRSNFASIFSTGSSSANSNVTHQFHVAIDTPAAHDPATAFSTVVAAAHNLEAKLAGAGQVGNNVGAALDGARSDALYAQLLFLFLGLPGVILAALLTSTVVGAGAQRRRSEQGLLRTRGLNPVSIARLAVIEALLVAVAGGLVGLAAAVLVGRWAFGSLQVGASGTPSATWAGIALLIGVITTGLTVLAPALADLRGSTVVKASQPIGRPRSPWWAKFGVDLILIAASVLVFRASSSNNYSLVLAPEGVATISVSYWAFLGPALLWGGTALLLWRLTVLGLAHGRRPLAALIRPLSGRLSRIGAASMSRQRRPLARSIVLLALAVSFAVSTATFNSTYRQQAEADALLSNGADITVTQSPGSSVGPAAGAILAQVPGVRHVEPLQHRFAYVGADLQDLYGVRPAGITRATALQDGYFVGGTASTLMDRLRSHPDSILVSQETVTDFQLAPGDLIRLRLQDSKTKKLRTVPFHYAGIVTEFPTAPKDSFFVANADYVAQTTGSDAVGAFLVDTAGTQQAAVADTIRRQLGPSASVTDISQTRSQVGSSLTSVNLTGLTRLELLFAVLLAAAAGGMVLAIGLAERRRSLAIMSVLGARRRQVRGLVVSEAALITVVGVSGGALISWALTHMLVKVLTGVFDPPPTALAVPWSYLAVTIGVVVLALAAAALFSSRSSARPTVEELREL